MRSDGSMASMSNTRHVKQKNRPRLVVAGEGPQSGTAELREALAAAGVPEEVVRSLDDVADAEDVLRRLETAGMLQPPEEVMTGLMDSWKPLLEPGCDPLSAELVGAEFVGMMRAAAEDEAELPEMLAELIAQAERHGGPEALAMLRVLAVIGPEEIRAVSAHAADRLVAGGLTDRPWVAGIGSAKAGSCFGYTDVLGAQEVVALTFSYGRKKHVLAVLIDHGLGGGVKDCWVSDRPGVIRSSYRNAARQHGLDVHDYEPAEARAILDRALAEQPCPVEPDQIDDVRDYLNVLRQRVALLPGGSAATPGPPRRDVASRQTIHKVKITLRGSKPPIWRRLEVPSGITLDRLHRAIQVAFGWQEAHLWVFDTPSGNFGTPDPELGHGDAARAMLADVAPEAGDRVLYTYDFGDDWEHVVAIEDVLTAEPCVAYPRCTAGRRASPPEDCGGMWGYAELLDILSDPRHGEHSDRLEWLGLGSGAEFDPAAFDRDEVNDALSKLARVLVKAGR